MLAIIRACFACSVIAFPGATGTGEEVELPAIHDSVMVCKNYVLALRTSGTWFRSKSLDVVCNVVWDK